MNKNLTKRGLRSFQSRRREDLKRELELAKKHAYLKMQAEKSCELICQDLVEIGIALLKKEIEG